jgi:hypothetical protein
MFARARPVLRQRAWMPSANDQLIREAASGADFCHIRLKWELDFRHLMAKMKLN